MQSATRGLQFNVASQAVAGGCDRDRHHEPARPVVEDVDRHHDCWAPESRLVADWVTEIYVVDLSSPDQASASHS